MSWAAAPVQLSRSPGQSPGGQVRLWVTRNYPPLLHFLLTPNQPKTPGEIFLLGFFSKHPRAQTLLRHQHLEHRCSSPQGPRGALVFRGRRAGGLAAEHICFNTGCPRGCSLPPGPSCFNSMSPAMLFQQSAARQNSWPCQPARGGVESPLGD